MTPFISRSALLALGVMLLGSGCRSVQRADYAPKEPDARAAENPVSHQPSPRSPDLSTSEGSDDSTVGASRWPVRWGEHPDRRGVIIELDPTIPLLPVHLSRYQSLRSTQTEYDDANTLAGAMGIEHGFKFSAEGPGCFVFVQDPPKKGTKPKANAPDLAFKFVSASKDQPIDMPGVLIVIQEEKDADKEDADKEGYLHIKVNRDGSAISKPVSSEDHVLLERTWFTYRDPKPKRDFAHPEHEATPVEPIGTIVLIPGMFGTPEPIVNTLERYWSAKGYAVLRMLSHPSRFTEHRAFHIAPKSAARIAPLVAIINDDRVAEGSYATKAALDHIHDLRPVLKGKPTILIGMSGGAMMLPTVYAYAPDDYDAAVIIAGGADFLRISIESNYKEWIDAEMFYFGDGPADLGTISKKNLDRFSKSYLAESKLDSYHTATEMGDIPVLMLHASHDRAVPASTGELLYHQLSEPERWSYPVGHELIFAALPTQLGRINRWISAHVEGIKSSKAEDQQSSK